jgi:high-affinity iron transporter
VITLREGIEAALVIGIIIGYLVQTGNDAKIRHVFLGLGAGILASVATAFAFQLFLGGFEAHEETFEGIFMLLAVALLTPFVLWMQKKGPALKEEIRQKTQIHLDNGQVWGLVGMTFLAVYREGVETVLFLKAALFQANATQVFTGSAMGLFSAMVLSFILFKGISRVNMGVFFKVTGVLLLLFAAGLTAHGVHELQEAGVLPFLKKEIWNVNGFLDENGLVGSFLKVLFGYNGNPSAMEFTAWVAYMFFVGRAFVISPSGKRIEAMARG